MVLEISLSELYTALYEDPDLRRLGKYRLVAESGQTILPVDLSDYFVEVDINFGDGDFTGGFFALCRTKAKSIDFGSCSFTDLYLDFLETKTVNFSGAKASRLYFDEANITDCYFNDFISGEIYFDTSTIQSVSGERLAAGIIFIEGSNSPIFDPESLIPNTHRLSYWADSKDSDSDDIAYDEIEVRRISKSEFIQYLNEDCDLRRLGPYKVISESDNDTLQMGLNLEGKDVWLGSGDFSGFSVSLGGLVAKTLDFGRSKFDRLDLAESKLENCFFYKSEAIEISFNSSEIENVFFERGRSDRIFLGLLKCGQFNINDMETDVLSLNESNIREMYLSVGEGVRNFFCEKAKLDLLNVHEGKIELLNFGNSEIKKALINKATIGVVRCEGLRADKLYIGNDGKNKIGELHLGLHLGIRELDLQKAISPKTDRTIIDRIY